MQRNNSWTISFSGLNNQINSILCYFLKVVREISVPEGDDIVPSSSAVIKISIGSNDDNVSNVEFLPFLLFNCPIFFTPLLLVTIQTTYIFLGGESLSALAK